MMKKVYAIAVTMLAAMPLAAQETYENVKIATEDLNGTARYVGMGGALEALGADISTISTNPAGIGLFRKSGVSVSFGLNSQQGVNNAVGGTKTNASFDQIGIVFSQRVDKTSYVNLGFNFHKSRNFDQILSASNSLDHASLSKLTWNKAADGLLYEEYKDAQDRILPDMDKPYITCNQLDAMLTEGGLDYDSEKKDWGYYDADKYRFDRSHTGYIGEYDFNISGNINNRVYLGLTVGVHDVHYNHYSEYSEDYPVNNGYYGITVSDDRSITGTGFDFKAGIIVRPVETSPFRVGLYVHSPTFYELRTSNYTTITDGDYTISSRNIYDGNSRSNYKFKLYTPWKFGLSLGHTFGSQLALGATYEYSDYSATDSREITDERYDAWTDSYHTRSESDRKMNDHTQDMLKGVSTLKLGLEYKPDAAMAIRLGYNYVSPMYKSKAFKDGALDSFGSYVSSATDFVNWDETHRITCGFGYTIDKFNISAAYQYSVTNGSFSPFMSCNDDQGRPDYINKATYCDVSNKRHQLLLTLGYTF